MYQWRGNDSIPGTWDSERSALGCADELRVVAIADGQLWGGVAMFRDDPSAPYCEKDVEFVGAPEGMDMAHADDPEYLGWLAKWSELQNWLFHQEFFRQRLGIWEGGETGEDNSIVRATFERAGVSIMGKRIFDLGERMWPEEAPFHTPVFVLTHDVREPWERPGGTTFYFVNDGIADALARARQPAGDRDIRISGGADTIVQALNAGFVDELAIDLAPVTFGGGTPLFGGRDTQRVGLDIVESIHSPLVTHLRFAVRRRGGSTA